VPSDEFFAKIMAHPIPTDLEAVKLLAPAPAAMDLFIWLSYRRDTATGRESIPLFGPGKWSLAHQISTVDSYPPAGANSWSRDPAWRECGTRRTRFDQAPAVTAGLVDAPMGGKRLSDQSERTTSSARSS
jgi:hypothetical protein